MLTVVYSEPTGKTAPRLLEDLLDYDPRRSKTKKYHLLADPAPQHVDAQKVVPDRKDVRDCRHDLLIKEGQSTGPVSADEKPTLSSTYVIATCCSKCRYHFHITVDYAKNSNQRKEPCSLESNNPLHHFRYVPNKSKRSIPKDETSKYDGHIELHHFKCSNQKCPAVTEIKITPPRLSNQLSKQFTDPAKLESRHRAAIKISETEGPGRFDKMKPLTPSAAMFMMCQYLTDALSQEAGETKRISMRNKKLMLGFGDCDEMFGYLDFGKSQEKDEEGVLQDYWTLPRITPSDNVDQIHFLQDVIFELSQLLSDRPSIEEREKGFSFNPEAAMKRLQRSYGCWNYPRKSREIDSVAMDHPHYASLGACADFTDELIAYCYFKQKRCDEPNKPYYLDCLAGIASGRESSELQVEVAKEDSSGELRLQTIREAYKFFAIDPSTSEGDDHILGVYRSRIESAPRQKDEARNCLKILAAARNSTKLEGVANDKSMTAEEAYEFLGVPPDTAADSLEAAAVVKSLDGDKSQVVKALRKIANTRNDPALHSIATALEPHDIGMLDVSQAYKTMQIEDQSMSDQNILMYYQSLMEKAMGQGSKDSYEKALRTIALDRKSDLLLAKLDNPDAVVGSQLSTAEHPVGLQNIGNTCYLNSLLQFYYTVKPIRDIVMNFQDYRMEVEPGDITKRVGGQVVGRGEIIKAQQFVEELGTLYSELKTASTADVKPSQRLAELALLSTEQENSFRRSSISSPRMTFDARSTSIMSPAPAADIPVPFDFNSPPQPSHPIPPVPGSIDVEMTDGPPPNTPSDQGDTSSEATLVNSDQISTQSINREVDAQMKDESNENKGKSTEEVAMEPQELATDSEYLTQDNMDVINGVDRSENATMVDGLPLPAQSAEPISGWNIGKPPPIPPRNKPGPINTASANDSSIGAEMLRFGSQQDVTEVIQNVLFRLSCAIKPIAKDVDNRNEQIDQIRNTFFGQSTIFLDKPEGWVSRQDDWNNLMVFPATNGTRSIYEALDVYFDPQIVEYDNMKLRQYASVKKLPPILQILIQRTAFDKTTAQASKNQNWIAADETIYLDRYLDSDSDSSLMARRREAWVWKEKLRQLDARRAILEETCTALTVPEAMSATAEALKNLQEVEIEGFSVDPGLIDSLEVRVDQTTRELAEINKQIAELRKRLDDQFTDLRKHKYTLQAVFMHRGTSTYGHYWIYIYDFATEIWREYNDEHVRIIEDTRKIFSPDTGAGNKATPYYLVYVNEEQKDELVDAVCRDLRASTAQDQNKISLPSVAENLDEGIDMGDEDTGTLMHIERVDSPPLALGPCLKRSGPDHSLASQT